MSWQNSSNWSVRVPEEGIRKLCPESLKALEDLLLKFGIEKDRLAKMISQESTLDDAVYFDATKLKVLEDAGETVETLDEKLYGLFNRLSEDFAAITGVMLGMQYLPSDEIEIYEEIEKDDYIWCADDAYGWTENGRELKEQVPGVELISWVSGG
jgi:hypothetical protein